MDIATIKQIATPILRKHGVIRASLFGSAVRGQMTKKSDIDILVEVPKDIDLFGFMDIQFELEDRLKSSVDLVEYQNIKPLLKSFIEKEHISIFSNVV